jgi:PleD family two-component response regulator
LEVDEILKNIAYILKEFKGEDNLIFRLQGAWFALYSPNLSKDQLILLAEKIRNTVALSKKFIERITMSIGAVSYGELMDEDGSSSAPNEFMYQVATKRVNIAKRKGMNIVCSSSALLGNEDQIGNILIVDADEANKDVLRIYIENSNCKAWSASNGEEALLLIDEQPMDLIITEVMLPQMDGFLLREKMLSQSGTKNIPFILLSYLKDDSAIKRASALNVLHYFKKPFMMSELTGTIDNIIERRN